MTLQKALRGIYKLGGLVLDKRNTTTEGRLKTARLCQPAFYCKILQSNEFIVLDLSGNGDYENVEVVSRYFDSCDIPHTSEHAMISLTQ